MLFDFGGTLDAPGVPWKERAWRLYRDEGCEVSRERFDPAFYRADDALVGALPPGCSLRETATRLFTALTEDLRPGDGALAARVTDRFVEDVERHAATSAAVLRALGRRYRLGLVSNFYGNLTGVCDSLALRDLFAVIVDSAEVGYAKPDPRIFEAALVRLGVGAGDATFVGDSQPRDMAGARGVGMRHVWLVGDATPQPAPCCAGDPLIRSLEELDGVLA